MYSLQRKRTFCYLLQCDQGYRGLSSSYDRFGQKVTLYLRCSFNIELQECNLVPKECGMSVDGLHKSGFLPLPAGKL